MNIFAGGAFHSLVGITGGLLPCRRILLSHLLLSPFCGSASHPITLRLVSGISIMKVYHSRFVTALVDLFASRVLRPPRSFSSLPPSATVVHYARIRRISIFYENLTLERPTTSKQLYSLQHYPLPSIPFNTPNTLIQEKKIIK